MSKGRTLLIVLIALPALSRPAAAGNAANRSAALALLKQARKDMADGDCRKAIEELHKGYRLHHHYVFPMLQGICLLRLDRPLEAKAMLLEAREVGGRSIGRRHRQLIASKLEAVATRLKYDKVSILTEPRIGVRIEVDGTVVGTSPLADPLVLNRGMHRLRASAPGRLTVSRTIEATGGETRSVTIELPPARTKQRNAGRARTNATHPGMRVDSRDGAQTGPPKGTKSEHPPQRNVSVLGKALFWGGIGGMALGALIIAPGAYYLAKDGEDAGAEYHAPYHRVHYDTKTPGVALTAVGATLLVAGAVALVTSFLLPDEKNHEQDEGPSARPNLGFSRKGVTLGLSGRF